MAVAVRMDTRPVGLADAAGLESLEAQAWRDMYAAAPAGFADRAGVRTSEIGGALVLEWAATGRRYFSRVIGLGVGAPATEEALDAILARYREAGISMFLLQSLPHCRPAQYEGWLAARGLTAFDAQDRVVRGGEPLLEAPPSRGERRIAVERVGSASRDEWAEYLARVYRLDAEEWLRALHGRPGWHQYVAREDGRIVGARGMYLSPDRRAWLGMDGPVPGVMSDDAAPDAAICAAIVADGLAAGVGCFIADIEAPAPEMDTPSYEYLGRLGFRRPYVRTHHARL
jgi:hypothetical protein